MANRINVNEAVLAARREMKNEKDLSPSFKTTMDGILDLVVTLANRLGLDSSNSSKPPSSDPNRAKKTRTTKGTLSNFRHIVPPNFLNTVPADFHDRVPLDFLRVVPRHS